MKKEELTELFCSRISLEQERYKKKILRLKPEEIYNRAYEIDCMINIGDILVEKCESMDEDILKCLMVSFSKLFGGVFVSLFGDKFRF